MRERKKDETSEVFLFEMTDGKKEQKRVTKMRWGIKLRGL